MSFPNHLSSTQTNFRRNPRLGMGSVGEIDLLSIKKQPDAMDKHFRTTSDDGLRLKSESIIVNRRKRVNCSEFLQRRKGKKLTTVSSTEYQSNENRCVQVQKEMNKKGKLDTKHVQEWLNTLLIEYCYEQRFDKTVRLSALKKFQIDRNSLLSKLLSHQEIDRLYRSLLVYSVGFNKLLKDVSKSSFVTKSIWRVYSLLIEYCAQGSFESMVAEIERQKVIQLNQLQEEIESKDKLLDNLNQVEKVNRAKAYKELKHLKQQHIQLKNQKAIIEEDFKQADQAFNQQVTLRLKFQHKINEVNGVHRELGMKHLLLFQDFETYKVEYQKLYEEKELLLRKIQDLSSKLFREEGERKEAESKQKVAQQIVKNLQDDLELAIMRNKNQEKSRRNEFLSRKELEITHLNHQITGLKSTLELREQGLDNRIHQINILIKENEHMHGVNEDQKVLITELEKKESNYQNRTVDLKTQIQMMEGKINQYIAEINRLNGEIVDLKQTLEETELNLRSTNEMVELMKSNGKNIDANLVEMKGANRKLETELSQLKSKVLNLDELASNRESLYGKAKSQLREQTERADLLEFSYKQLDTEHKLQKKSNQKAVQSLRSAIQDLQTLNSNLQQSNKSLQKALDKLQTQNYQLKMNDERNRSNLIDQKFERKQIDLQFKQSLLLVNDEKNQIKELTIQMTEVKEERDKLMLEIKSLQYFNTEKEKSMNNKMGVLEGKLKISAAVNYERGNHVHPMIFEDVRSQLIYSIQKHNTVNYLHQELIKSLGPKQQEINKKLKRLKREYQYTYNEFKADMDKKLMLKDRQLQEKGRECDILQINMEQLKKNLNMKIEYLEIVEEKHSVQCLINKELESEKEMLKERNQDLNRSNCQLMAKCEGLEERLEQEKERMKRTIEQEREEMDGKMAEMLVQLKRNQALRSNTPLSGNGNTGSNNNEQDGSNQNGAFKSIASENQKGSFNPQSPALIRNNQPNQFNQPNNQSRSHQRPNLLNTQSSFKNKTTNGFSKTHKTGEFNTTQYSEFNRAEKTEAHPHSAEKEINRKIKNAVSYYTRPPK